MWTPMVLSWCFHGASMDSNGDSMILSWTPAVIPCCINAVMAFSWTRMEPPCYFMGFHRASMPRFHGLPWCFHGVFVVLSWTLMVLSWYVHGACVGFHDASMAPPWCFHGLRWCFDGAWMVMVAPWTSMVPSWCFHGALVARPWCFHGARMVMYALYELPCRFHESTHRRGGTFSRK